MFALDSTVYCQMFALESTVVKPEKYCQILALDSAVLKPEKSKAKRLTYLSNVSSLGSYQIYKHTVVEQRTTALYSQAVKA